MEQKKNHIKLEEIKKNNVFNVPDRYFEDLPGIIQSKTTALPKKENHLSSLLSIRSLRYALPALLILIGLFFFVNPQKTTNDLSSISEEEILDYLSIYDDNEADIYASASDLNIEINIQDFIEIDNNSDLDYYELESYDNIDI